MTGLTTAVVNWVLIGTAILVTALYTILKTIRPLIHAFRNERQEFKKKLPEALEELILPLGLGAIILLSLANHNSITETRDRISQDIGRASTNMISELAKHSYRVEVFPDTTSFFEDLRTESLRESVRSSFVTLIRHATNEEYPDRESVDAYYASVLQRCRSDERFTLWRVLGVTNAKMLHEAKTHASVAQDLPNYELRVFRWSQQHNPINLVVLEDDRGPNTAYIIVPPSSKARLQTIKLSNAREIARILKRYHATLFENATEPTRDHLLQLERTL